MKRCPQCNRVETDDTLAFCRIDRVELVNDSGSFSGDAATVKFGSGPVSHEIETSLPPHTSTTPEINRSFLARSGQRDEARKLLEELKLESTRRYVTSYGVALAHIGLNEKEEAFVWLEKEVAERGYWAGVYAVAPELDHLRNDPRFKEMLKRLSLPE